MTDREELGRRMVETMGWEQHWNTPTLYIIPLSVREALGLRYSEWVSVKDIVCWPGYGMIDQVMRERGYTKHLEGPMPIYDGAFRVTWYDSNGQLRGVAAATDEPRAAIEAALKALEENHE